MGEVKPVTVEFVGEYDGEINFETDECQYILYNGSQLLAKVIGYLQVTDEDILLVASVSWRVENYKNEV